MLLLMLVGALTAPLDAAPDPWGPWRPYIGRWSGRDKTPLGDADATVSWQLDLDNHVLIRRNDVKYPDQHHTDLLIISPKSDGYEGIYFDNEGHTIHYAGTASPTGIMLTSTDSPGPRFRLLLTVSGNTCHTVFLMAPAGQDFKTYTAGDVKRAP